MSELNRACTIKQADYSQIEVFEIAADAEPRYEDYGISHSAKLKVDFEQGRLVFF